MEGWDVVLKDCKLKSNRQHGLAAKKCKVQLVNCTIKENVYGVHIVNPREKIHIHKCRFLKADTAGIYIEELRVSTSLKGLLFEQCHYGLHVKWEQMMKDGKESKFSLLTSIFKDCKSEGISLECPRDAIIRHCILRNCRVGMFMQGREGYDNTSVRIVNNLLENMENVDYCFVQMNLETVEGVSGKKTKIRRNKCWNQFSKK